MKPSPQQLSRQQLLKAKTDLLLFAARQHFDRLITTDELVEAAHALVKCEKTARKSTVAA